MKNLNKKGLLGYILGIVLLCLIDQLTKIAAVSALKGKSPFVLIKNVLEFYYLENAGMAWVLGKEETLARMKRAVEVLK